MTKNQNKNWGEMILYFGCRQSNIDDLYRNEIEQLISENIISKVYFAYSREPNQKKVYVQDILEKNIDEVYDAIFNRQGHFYVCGDVRMATKVEESLELALQKSGKMSIEEAKEYLFKMKEDLRFHEDIFGNNITSNKN